MPTLGPERFHRLIASNKFISDHAAGCVASISSDSHLDKQAGSLLLEIIIIVCFIFSWRDPHVDEIM